MSENKTVLTVGDTAPNFTAKTSDGGSIQLNELVKSASVVLIFYPGDDTPVCTKQLCSFRDSFEDLKALDCAVFGVNPANEAKHAKFAHKHGFPFPLIVDAGGEVAKLFGCRGIFGIITRWVFVIGSDRKVLYAVKGNPPVSDILAAVRGS
jgi:peroxiredoxin Q/BCP